VTWVRTDDGCPYHPKMLRAGAEACWLWQAGNCYSNAHRLNGKIGKDLLPVLYPPLGSKAKRLATKLVAVGLWHDRGDHYEIHDYRQYQEQALKEVVEARREYERERKRKQRSAGHVPDRVPDDSSPVPDPCPNGTSRAPAIPARPVPARPSPDGEKGSDSGASPAPPSGPSVAEQVRGLEAAYPDTVTLHEARDACAMSRRNGRMADTVWLRTLQAMAEHPRDSVLRACRTFADKYSDGEKDERYLLGIVRSEAKGKRSNKGPAPPSPASAFRHDDPDEVWGKEAAL
jgi:hypothetical protein